MMFVTRRADGFGGRSILARGAGAGRISIHARGAAGAGGIRISRRIGV